MMRQQAHTALQANPADLHSMLMFSNYFDEFANKLYKDTGLNNFGVVEISSLGYWRVFNSNAAMFAESIEANILDNTPSNVLQTFSSPGYYLLDADKHLQIKEASIQKMYEKYSYGHGFRIVDIKQRGAEQIFQLYTFETSYDNQDAYKLYFSCLNLIEKFKNTFNDKVKLLKSTLPLTKEEMILLQDVLSQQKNLISIDAKAEPIEPSISPVIYNIPKLTKRENEIVQWFVAGMNSHETSVQLKISRKTVDRHFENIRDKLNCKNKFAIYKKLKELETL